MGGAVCLQGPCAAIGVRMPAAIDDQACQPQPGSAGMCATEDSMPCLATLVGLQLPLLLRGPVASSESIAACARHRPWLRLSFSG